MNRNLAMLFWCSAFLTLLAFQTTALSSKEESLLAVVRVAIENSQAQDSYTVSGSTTTRKKFGIPGTPSTEQIRVGQDVTVFRRNSVGGQDLYRSQELRQRIVPREEKVEGLENGDKRTFIEILSVDGNWWVRNGADSGFTKLADSVFADVVDLQEFQSRVFDSFGILGLSEQYVISVQEEPDKIVDNVDTRCISVTQHSSMLDASQLIDLKNATVEQTVNSVAAGMNKGAFVSTEYCITADAVPVVKRVTSHVKNDNFRASDGAVIVNGSYVANEVFVFQLYNEDVFFPGLPSNSGSGLCAPRVIYALSLLVLVAVFGF